MKIIEKSTIPIVGMVKVASMDPEQSIDFH